MVGKFNHGKIKLLPSRFFLLIQRLFLNLMWCYVTFVVSLGLLFSGIVAHIYNVCYWQVNLTLSPICMLSPITLIHSSLNPELTFQLKAGEICIRGGEGGGEKESEWCGEPACKRIFDHTYLPTYHRSTFLSTHPPSYPPTYLPIYPPSFLPTY